jgi:hypothetical protein
LNLLVGLDLGSVSNSYYSIPKGSAGRAEQPISTTWEKSAEAASQRRSLTLSRPRFNPTKKFLGSLPVALV